MTDPAQLAAEIVNHPRHYNAHPSGVECITIVEHMGFNLGNAIKYIWRADLKSASPVEDLEKARWYIDRELARISPPTNPAEAIEQGSILPAGHLVVNTDG